MSTSTKTLYRTAITIIAPAVMMASFILHPHVGNPIDADFLEKLAAAVIDNPAYWGIVHYMTGVGIGLMMLAFIAVRSHLRETADESWTGPALPFIIIGSTLYALLPAMELAPMAAAETYADIEQVQAVQGALMSWFVPTLFASAVLFAIGAAGFAAGFVRGGIENPQLKWIIAGAMIIMALSRFVPVNVVQFYVQGIAGLIALWPMAYIMWQHTGYQFAEKPEVSSVT